LSGNFASMGGGCSYGTLNNCTLIGNAASNASGGVDSATLNNCILYYNQAPSGSDYSASSLNYCCTPVLPTSGEGSFTNTPLLVNQATADLRLQPSSPCINAGDNSYVTATKDLDGNPRIVAGTVDIGAYEFQRPTSIVSYA